VIWLAVGALLAGVAPVMMQRFQGILDPVAVGLAVLAVAAAAAALWLLWRRRKIAAVGAMTLAAALIWTNAFGHVLPQLHAVWLSNRIDAAARAARACDSGVLATTPYNEPSLIFLYGREQTRITPSGAEAADALAAAPQCGLALVGADDRAAFLARAAERGLDLRAVDRIRGQNYSNGDHLDLTLYAMGAGAAAEHDDVPR
jgi:hypothetical protein